MESIKTIVNGTQASLSHICNGKACYKNYDSRSFVSA